MKILGVIVTYHSDADRLIQNLNAVTKQIHDILLIDNGSDEQTVQLLYSLYERYPDNNIILKHAKKNNGIAWALRRGMEYAKKKEYDWVLTLDQDSVMLDGLMGAYMNAIQETQSEMGTDAYAGRAGAFTCVIQDRNFTDEDINGSVKKGLEKVKEAITSGFFISVEAYQKISGYDDKLFIDYVDYDVCYQLLEAGYQIYRIPYVGLLHEYGKVSRKKFLGKRPMVTNHPAWRNYYMVRNMYIMSEKHPKYVTKKDAAHNAKSVFLRAVVYEQDKVNKVKQILRGVREGKKYLHE